LLPLVAIAVTLYVPAGALLLEYESEDAVAVSLSIPSISHLIVAGWLKVISKFIVSPAVDSGVVSSGLKSLMVKASLSTVHVHVYSSLPLPFSATALTSYVPAGAVPLE